MQKLKTVLRHVAVAVALCAPLAVGAQEPAARDSAVASIVERAQRLYDRGQSNDALSLVDEARKRAPGDPEARFLQGLIYADVGRTDDAIEVFASLTADYPELPEPWNNLAVLFAENGEFDKARQALLAAIQTHPSYSTAHENLGDLYARMAGMAYDRALEQDVGNESARLKLSAVNGLFSIPAVAPVQVAAAEPAPVRAAAPPRQTVAEPVRQATTPPPVREPEPVAVSEPVRQPPVTTTTPPVSAPAPAPVQVAVTEPVTPRATTPAVDQSGRVADAVRAWAAAWSTQNVDGYLNSYAQSFRPANGASRASWVRYRRDRLVKPSFIQVDVSDLDVSLSGPDTATARFIQRYRSDNYEDRVRKTMNMTLTDSGWQIAGEVSEAL